MKNNQSKHMIEMIFPIVLFFVFVVSSVILVVISADFYGRNTSEIQAKGESRTALSYLTTKFRQNDSGGQIQITEIEGTDCLTFKEEGEVSDYYTYIYLHDGNLMELFISDGVDFSLADGTTIMPLHYLSMTESEDGLFTFETIDARQIRCHVTLGERSEHDE
ncbi:hypothetical protein M2145_001675 [Lachnospiraceae bacterium PF1-21]|uniref:DUF4860 domain-containing protein n=1 Tax=Ohessyouella blattaphilus TaxID=2949333 RepID=A0ABT1EH37_9FIRM|nr:DUF4860 domain-containing protein [Ohessyouella blattaphilus]MCP1110003.1 DUF4860 domain-containing protein [Ohessyouella blattaphilus]MCR8563397.1 DUF4860 domain-containing protein [Ohessyouella blattaphilus]MDL2249139.1 DUF4860 domain-containing protein [Lachnospiraceae bacterium OttesenSCG-928-J05]